LRLTQLYTLGDFLLRALFFAAAPFLLVFIAELFPVTGALIQVGIGLGAMFTAEALRKLERRFGLLGRLLSSQLALETYYREHPPRPFLYYVLFPLLFPYWLSVKSARREFWLYKGYTWPAFAFLALSLIAQYARDFLPELTLRDFAPLALGSFAAETIAVLMFLMPMVTSVVAMHQRHARGRLGLLFMIASLSVGLAVARIERRRNPIVSFATRVRVRLRDQAEPTRGYQARAQALSAAAATLPSAACAQERDRALSDAPLEAARAQLSTFYKNDEAHAFELWLSCARGESRLIVFFPSHRGHAPLWLSRTAQGALSSEPSELSTRMRHVLRVTPPARAPSSSSGANVIVPSASAPRRSG
jgi:hypothetical protein